MPGTQVDIVGEVRRLVEEKIRSLEKKFGDPLLYLDKNNFDEVLTKYKIVVVEFASSWCNPCKAYTPVFRRVARILSAPEKGVVFAYVDTDESPDLADRYGVNNIPTTIVFVDGHVADVVMGATQESRLKDRVEAIIKEAIRVE